MKILIIANSQIVFGKELKNELQSFYDNVTLLDFASLSLYNANDHQDFKYSERFKKYKDIPKISMFFRMYHIKKIIEENKYDVINIHVSRWFYLMILPWLLKQKFIITFYGSDFYRTSNLIKNLQRPLYRFADKITFTNPLTKASFLEYYKEFNDKCRVCRFGLKTLDFIDKNRVRDKKEIRRILGYDLNKIIVTCGYNSTKAQQHSTIIDNLILLPQSIKNNVQFIFPLTYGDSYNREKVKKLLADTDLDYIILDDFLYKDENAYIKLASDVMINVLQTDSFSGSMQEFLYGGNAVITGSWLPYDVLEREGIKYFKIDRTDQLRNILEELILNLEEMKKNLDKNIDIIHKLSSWENNIKCWMDVYEN